MSNSQPDSTESNPSSISDPIASLSGSERGASKRLKPVNLVVGLAVLGIIAALGATVLGLFGIGGNQIEHGNVTFDLSPDSKQVAFSSASGGLYALDLNTKTVTGLYNGKSVACSPKYSPDGKTIVFVGKDSTRGQTSLYRIPALGGQDTLLATSDGASDFAPSFSPDGKEVVFVRAARKRPYSMGGTVWDDFDIWMLDLSSGATRQITSQKYRSASSPCFADGGKSILYTATVPGGSLAAQMFRVGEAKGSIPQPFMLPTSSNSVHGAWASDLAVSKDGKHLVFLSDRAEAYAYDIFTSQANGENPVPLHFAQTSRYNRSPVFARDGASIYVLAGTESNAHGRPIYSLFQVDLKGKATCVADSGLFTHPTSWKPN